MGTSTQTPSLPLLLCPYSQFPRDLERGQGSRQLVAGRADPAACRVPSCPGRGSLPAESPPHPPSFSSRGHARPLAAGIAATALEKHQHMSALQGDVCPLTWKGEQRGEWWGQLQERGTGHWGTAGSGHPPRADTGLWHPTLSILPKPRLHSNLLQDGTRPRGAQAGPKAREVAERPLPHWLHQHRLSTTIPGPPNLCCSSPVTSPPIFPGLSEEPLGSLLRTEPLCPQCFTAPASLL